MNFHQNMSIGVAENFPNIYLHKTTRSAQNNMYHTSQDMIGSFHENVVVNQP
jgi:hypothetical protein